MSIDGLAAAIEGVWLPVAAFVSGKEVPVDELRVARLVLRAGHYEIVNRNEEIVDTGDYTIDAAVLPRAMDIVGVSGPNAGRSMAAIFELDDEDRLTLCYDLEGEVRPDDMEAEEDELLLKITYARAARQLS
jgi:uncharacterized protein (TIGR03067 family)